MRLKNKVAVITGSATGNGKAIALGFAREGAKIIVFDLDEKRANQTAHEINQIGAESIAISGDVSNTADIDTLVNTTVKKFGSIDILVNNAGIFTKSDFLEMAESDFDKTIKINLKGIFIISQKVARIMKDATTRGSIINISSINGGGCSVRPNSAAYASSKGGVSSLTKVMAVDLAKYKIRVNAIAPGYFKTEMTKGLLSNPDYLEEITSRIPLGYIASPEQLVGPATFLASDESDYVTGAILPVDGGWWALK